MTTHHLSSYVRAPGRPGILTAVGVVSIVVASLGLIGSGFTGLAGLFMVRAARLTTSLASSSGSGFNQSVHGAAADPAKFVANPISRDPSRQGMSDADCAKTIDALNGIEPVSESQKRQLQTLLRRSGASIFTSPAEAAAAVKLHGTLPPESADEESPVYFNTALGHLEVHDNRALFRFTDPNERAIRTSAEEEASAAVATPVVTPAPTTTAPDPADPFAPAAPQADPFANADTQPTTAPVTASSSNGGLTAAQVATIIAKAQAVAGGKMNAAQVQALQTELAKSGQTLVPPGTIWSPVSVAIMQPDGSVLLKMSGGFLMIDAQGTINTRINGSSPRIALNPTPMALVAAESLASLALAGFLMFSGIMLLRHSSQARGMHQVFALVKIPLALIAMAAFWWMMDDIADNLRQVPGAGTPTDGFIVFGLVLAGAGLIYPVALLITMQSRSVRDYYSASSAR